MFHDSFCFLFYLYFKFYFSFSCGFFFLPHFGCSYFRILLQCVSCRISFMRRGEQPCLFKELYTCCNYLYCVLVLICSWKSILAICILKVTCLIYWFLCSITPPWNFLSISAQNCSFLYNFSLLSCPSDIQGLFSSTCSYSVLWESFKGPGPVLWRDRANLFSKTEFRVTQAFLLPFLTCLSAMSWACWWQAGLSVVKNFISSKPVLSLS